MSLDEEVWRMIWSFPTLFCDVTYQKSRIKALGHLYLVLGNGYEWQDGQLVEKPPCGEVYPGEGRNTAVWSPYPLTEGAAIANLPDDIRPDWLEGAAEIWMASGFHQDINSELSRKVTNRIVSLREKV